MSLLNDLRRASDPRDAALEADPRALRALIDECGGGTALAREVGYDGSSQRFKDIDFYNRHFLESLDAHANPENAAERVWENRARRLEAENLKLLDWRELVSDTIKAARLKFSPVRAPKPRGRGKRDDRIAIQCIGDVHVGELVTREDTGGVAEYNFAIFLERVAQFKEHFTAIIDEQRLAYNVPTCIVNLDGDMATGEGVFPKQLARLDLFLEDQIMQGAFHLAELLQFIASMFPRVVVFAVPGNHTPKDLTLSADRLMYRVMALLLQDQPNVEFVTSASHYLGYRISEAEGYCNWTGGDREWSILLTHAHQARRYQSVPYYSLDRLVMKYANMTDRVWDMMYCGHGHPETAGVDRWRMNGCWPGGTEYSTETMQGASRPMQHLDFWHPALGITSSHEVYLADKVALGDPDGNGVYTPTVEWIA